ncbi:MULE transposase domain-containing protein [Plasmodiophora brassicae]
MDRLDFKNYGAYMASTYKILGAAALGGDPHDGGAEKLLLRDEAKWMNFGRHRQWSHPGEMWVRSCLQAGATWKKYRICHRAPADMPDLIVKYPQQLTLDAAKMQSLWELSASIPVQYRPLYPAPDQGDLAVVRDAVASKKAAKRRPK